MQIAIKGKQLDVGEALRTHVTEVMEQVVGKYFNNPIECTVFLSKEAHLLRADISAHIGRGILLQAQGEAPDAYTAFDVAAERIAKRLRRYKRRLRDHHRSREGGEAWPAQQYVIAHSSDGEEVVEVGAESEDQSETGAEAPNEGPVIIAEMESVIETLSVSEAVMRMELADLPALMFRNSANGRIAMVYYRNDGNIGWVETQPQKAPRVS